MDHCLKPPAQVHGSVESRVSLGSSEHDASVVANIQLRVYSATVSFVPVAAAFVHSVRETVWRHSREGEPKAKPVSSRSAVSKLRVSGVAFSPLDVPMNTSCFAAAGRCSRMYCMEGRWHPARSRILSLEFNAVFLCRRSAETSVPIRS